MQDRLQLLVMLIAYYATFGIMGVGFATMVAGRDGAAAAGKFLFVRPLRTLVDWARTAVVAVIVALWGVVSVIARWIAGEIKEVAKDIRWLVARERGWVRRR